MNASAVASKVFPGPDSKLHLKKIFFGEKYTVKNWKDSTEKKWENIPALFMLIIS